MTALAGRRIAFVSTMCQLDPVSGAAISVRSILETLAGAGAEVSSLTASVFDRNGEQPFAPVLGPNAAKPENVGKVLRRPVAGVEHRVLLTESSRLKNVTDTVRQRLRGAWQRHVREFRPEIVLTFGTSAVARAMQADARAAGARVVFYLGNAEIDAGNIVQAEDRIVCPSRFLAAQYRAQSGARADVLHPVIRPERFVAEGEASIAADPSRRRLGFVTVINPIPQKGLALIGRLARRAGKERPEMTFCVVEGRMTKEAAARVGSSLPGYSNVWWLAQQQNLREVYRRSSALLVPSFWREGFGRVVVEAQLSGLPVFASRIGGLPEALGDGGRALDVPEAHVADFFHPVDDALLEHWWAPLREIWDDEAAYAAMAARARPGAARFAPGETRAAVVARFAEIAGLPAP